jgi:hypothetical protein
MVKDRGKVETVEEEREREVIARDTINGSQYDFSIEYIMFEGKPGYRVELRFRGGNWEPAMMGVYNSKKAALEAFVPRYRTFEIENLEAIHPVIKKCKEDKLRQLEMDRKAEEEARIEAMEQQQLDSQRREDIEADLKKTKFTRGSATPKGSSGKELPIIVGYVLGGLLIHKLDEKTNGRMYANYNITHIQSGYAVGPRYHTLKDAKIAVIRMSQYVDFTLDAEGLIELGKSIPINSMFHRLQGDPYADLEGLLVSVKEEGGE